MLLCLHLYCFSSPSLCAPRMFVRSIVFLVLRSSIWLCIGLSHLCLGSCLSSSPSRLSQICFILPRYSLLLPSRVSVACERQDPTQPSLDISNQSPRALVEHHDPPTLPASLHRRDRVVSVALLMHLTLPVVLRPLSLDHALLPLPLHVLLGLTSPTTPDCNAGRLTADRKSVV